MSIFSSEIEEGFSASASNGENIPRGLHACVPTHDQSA
jgi:hypothetical protein